MSLVQIQRPQICSAEACAACGHEFTKDGSEDIWRTKSGKRKYYCTSCRDKIFGGVSVRTEPICNACGLCCSRLDIAEVPIIADIEEELDSWGEFGMWIFDGEAVYMHEPHKGFVFMIEADYLHDYTIELMLTWQEVPVGYWMKTRDFPDVGVPPGYIVLRIPVPCRHLTFKGLCEIYGTEQRADYCHEYFCEEAIQRGKDMRDL